MNSVVVRLRACAPMVVALLLAALTLRLAPSRALVPQWLPYAPAVLALTSPGPLTVMSGAPLSECTSRLTLLSPLGTCATAMLARGACLLTLAVWTLTPIC